MRIIICFLVLSQTDAQTGVTDTVLTAATRIPCFSAGHSQINPPCFLTMAPQILLTYNFKHYFTLEDCGSCSPDWVPKVINP
ncbi:hypothetical protein XELAEV_18040348mg [Xenopus laevis]|uniref:Uncharacterized protein n=1 Tax=Xenopus laevis TaxID=8355 RepID=A0A974C9A8_XENLA|nr:hypothetical protein XELAEV_18040348mg [Xenopus laevis]